MFVLDTNVISELRRKGKADRNVAAWAEGAGNSNLYLSVITILEVQIGALSMLRKDAIQGRFLQDWIDNKILPGFAGRILPLDTKAVLCCARLHVPDRRSERDAMIAATAIAHDMTVVSRNIADFVQTGVKLCNPWLPRAGF